MQHFHNSLLSHHESGIIHSFYIVTPKMAEHIARKAGLDPVRLANSKGAKSIASVLLSNQWEFNGEAIVLDTSGRVLDGEQRLGGCILSGVSMPTLVILDVDPGIAHTISTHKKRTARDTLSVMGEVDAGEMQGAAMTLKRIANGTCRSLHSGSGGLNAFQIKAIFEVHPALEDSLDVVTGMNLRELPGLGKALLAAFHYVFQTVDPKKAADFFDYIDHHRTDQKVAKALTDALAVLAKAGNNHRRVAAAAMLVQAWNAFYEGRENVRLGYDPDAGFPEIAGFQGLDMPPETVPMAEGSSADGAHQRSIDIFDDVLASAAGARIEVREFSPAEAAEILATRNGPSHSGKNRPISRSRVEALVRDFNSGSWKLNGQTVKFTAEGRLIDGQHRLQACVETGIPLRTFVLYGLPENAFATIDAGASRNFSRSLKRIGTENHGILANILPVLVRWDWGKIGRPVKPTQSECVAALEKYGQAINASLNDARFKGEAAIISTVIKPQWAHAANVILSGIDTETARDFLSKTVLNNGIVPGDVWFAVNDGLKRSVKDREARVFFILFDGWNRVRAGKTAASQKLYAGLKGEVPDPI